MSERLVMFIELQQLIHSGRVGDSVHVAMLDQQLGGAFEGIFANYVDQPSFLKFFAFFRNTTCSENVRLIPAKTHCFLSYDMYI